MMRLSRTRLDLHTTTTASPSWRATPMRNLLGAVVQSPYKDSFKEYWSTPVPWQPREYGVKPKIGDPIPLREATTVLVAAKNQHMDPAKVASGEDNDYKILMMFREPQGRYHKDQFVLPSSPVHLADRDEDWGPLLMRLGVKTPHSDMTQRIAALRALLVEANLIALPPEGGGLAEVEGPPGGRKWHMMIMSQPSMMRQFVDVLQLPMEGALNSFLPFLRLQTPNTEQFRFDSTSFILPFHKCPEVKYCISTLNEELFWVSPKEALARYEAGVMELPTPTTILFNEMAKHFPKFDDIQKKLTMDTEPKLICPELVHDPETRMATVLCPGDVHHSETPALRAETIKKRRDKKRKLREQILLQELKRDADADEQQQQQHQQPQASSSTTTTAEAEEEEEDLPQMFYRFRFEKDEPAGVKSILVNRPVTENDDLSELPRMEEKFIEPGAPQLRDSSAERRREEEEMSEVRAKRQQQDLKHFESMISGDYPGAGAGIPQPVGPKPPSS